MTAPLIGRGKPEAVDTRRRGFRTLPCSTTRSCPLPSIQRDLGIGVSELEWIVNGYALTFGVLMLAGGKFADLLGRRFIFIAGVALFTLSSLACGLASGAGVLIGARVVQGVGRRS